MERRPGSRGGILARGRALAVGALVLALVPALAADAAVNDTTFVSVTGDATLADGPSGPGVIVNPSGRYVAFESTADNLSDDDDDSVVNIYLHDRETGATQLVSRATGVGGAGANGSSANPAISPAGRYVAFESRATNLSDADGDDVTDVFLRDTQANTTTLISRAPGGLPADGDSGDPSVSANAAVVVFESRATNLTDADTNGAIDVFLDDRTTGTTSLVSRPASGVPADGPSFDPTVSNNGRRIAFASDADNLFNDDRDGFTNVYVSEPRFRLLTHVSRTTTSGSQSDPANGGSTQPVISSDGAHVAFVSAATNLAGGVGIPQVFVHDLSARTTDLVSRANGLGGAMGTGTSTAPSISGDGRLVAFASNSVNLVPDPSLLGSDVYVRDTAWETTALLSRESGPGGAALGESVAPALSRYGTLLAFTATISVPVDETTSDLRPLVLARELKWAAPPVYVPPPDDNSHEDHGSGDHTDHDAADHDAAGHDAAGHDASGDGHGDHGAGGAHFTLRLGGAGADRLVGTPLYDKLCGGGGNDVILLGGGPDVGYGGECGIVEPPTVTKSGWWLTQPGMWRHARVPGGAAMAGAGAPDNDRLTGGKGDDALFGGAGNDRVVGGSGRDFLSGGSGRDRLVGGPGRNRYEGGTGNDSINSANGVRELVDCGFGRDRVKADRRDVLSGCERVKRVRRKRKLDPIELLPECPGGGHECHKDGTTVVLSRARRAG